MGTENATVSTLIRCIIVAGSLSNSWTKPDPKVIVCDEGGIDTASHHP